MKIGCHPLKDDTRVDFYGVLCKKSSQESLNIRVLRHADKSDGHNDTADDIEL